MGVSTLKRNSGPASNRRNKVMQSNNAKKKALQKEVSSDKKDLAEQTIVPMNVAGNEFADISGNNPPKQSLKNKFTQDVNLPEIEHEGNTNIYPSDSKNFNDEDHRSNSEFEGDDELEGAEHEEKNILSQIKGLKSSNLFKRHEEIDPEVQNHLKDEFEVYANHKLEMIEQGVDIVPEDQKEIKTKDEKKDKFLDRKARFLKKMTGRKRTFWGTKKYTRILNKWFFDYDNVIAHKVTVVKNTINESIDATNKNINEVVVRFKEAIAVADTDMGKASQLIGTANEYLIKANEHKKIALSTLDEYGKDKSDEYAVLYDEVLVKYQDLIASLMLNIQAIAHDSAKFEEVIVQLSAQQNLLSAFGMKVNTTTDVLELIDLQKNEFVQLITNADKTLLELKQVGRTTGAVDEIHVKIELETHDKTIVTIDTRVEEIKQKEIKRREEEERKRKEEELRKKEEAARLKKEQDLKDKQKKDEKNVPAIFVKDDEITTTASKKGKSQSSSDIIKSRGGSDYTKTKWTNVGAAKTAVNNIDESKFSKTDIVFFAQYKKTCDDYLEKYYKGQTNLGHKLTGDMFVNAAKRIYIKYGHLSYIVPAEMALVQGNTETNLNTSGAKGYNNPFNVGETDKGAKSWVKEMTSPEIGIFFYMDLLAHDYLSDKTADQLLESYVNEDGSRFATSPHYEMELKAGMGQIGLVRDGKQPTVDVGRKYEKNDKTESAIFVRGMLTQLGYKQTNLGDAIEAFQSEKMFPALTPEQQKNVDNMNSGDRKNFNIKEKNGVDGIANRKAYTVGLLYYMTYMGNNVTNFSGDKGITVKTDKGKKVNELYEQYKNSEIDMIGLGKALVPYCKYFGEEVLAVFDDLGWGTEDNLAYVLANKSTDIELQHFDSKLLERMKVALDPENNYSSVAEKKMQWERVKKALGETGSVGKAAGNIKKDDKKGTNNTKRTTIAVDFKISGSVGSGGDNVVEDVKKIQDLLINFNYLKEDDIEVKLVAQTIKDKPGTKLKDSQLPNTISAIKQFQKYGATTGNTLFTQDGKVDKSGGTITSMRELNRIDVNYKDQKFEEDIPDLLKETDYVSQARYGANFSSGSTNKTREKEYINFVKEKTGLDDPADLHTAPDDKQKLVKDEYGKYSWQQNDFLKTHGLKMNQKEYFNKPNWICCYDAAKLMLVKSGATEKAKDFKLQTYVADQVTQVLKDKEGDIVKEKGKDKTETVLANGKYTNQVPVGIKYIDGQLKAGNAVFVGVEKGKVKTDNEYVTDHYIIIIGKHKDGKKYYYSFYDPALTNSEGVNTTTNRLYISSDKSSVENKAKTYKLSQIRTNNE